MNKTFITLVIIIGLCISIFVLFCRSVFERKNNTVEIVVDFKDIQKLGTDKTQLTNIAQQFLKLAPLSFGIYEETIESLQNKGKAVLLSSGEINYLQNYDNQQKYLSPFSSMLIFPSSNKLTGLKTLTTNFTAPGGAYTTISSINANALKYLRNYSIQTSVLPLSIGGKKNLTAFVLSLPKEDAKNLSLGFDTADIKDFSKSALLNPYTVVARLANTPYETSSSINAKIGELRKIKNLSAIVFDGESILGYPSLINLAGDKIKNFPNIKIGDVEFFEQKGFNTLRNKFWEKVIPVHSISEEEMKFREPEENIARFVRAVKERGVRMLYIRLFTHPYGITKNEIVEYNVDYINKLLLVLRGAGFQISQTSSLGDFAVSPVFRFFILISSLVFCIFLISAYHKIGWQTPCSLSYNDNGTKVPHYTSNIDNGTKVPHYTFNKTEQAFCFFSSFGINLGILSVLIILCLATVILHLSIVIKIISLFIAIVVPSYAIAIVYLKSDKNEDNSKFIFVEESNLLWLDRHGVLSLQLLRGLVDLLKVTAITFCGALFIAAMLSDRQHFLRIQTFSGIKVAFVAPFLLLFLLYLNYKQENIVDFFLKNVKYYEVAAAMLLICVLAIYILRSGNESPAGISSLESAARKYLEALLSVRPRTKEFLIGHPVLIILGMLLTKKVRGYTWLIFLSVGMIGQISIINTFCHLHTPILTSFFRTILGLLIGCAVGICASFVLKIFKVNVGSY